jgi:tetratricopeptide (TPR) repeat protein
MADLELVQRRFSAFIRSHDFSGAASFLADAFLEAKESGDREGAAEIGDLLAGALTAGGRDLEALDVYRELLADFPKDAFLNLRVATFLTTLLKRPSEALETLAPVLEELLQDETVRHAALGVWGANNAVLGNMEEAERCFGLLLKEDLSGMDASSIDLLLVEALISWGELKGECREYLSRVVEQAGKTGEEGVADRARSLLSTPREKS